VQKLGSAFWDAFAGHGGADEKERRGRMGAGVDADKVRRVLEGRAVLRVVDVEPQQQQHHATPAQAQAQSLARPVALAQTRRATPPPAGGAKEKECMDCSLTSILEESMRSLSISKKGHL
jgi:bZIP-type transcription factor MBZ1